MTTKSRLPLFLAKYSRFEFFPVWLVYIPLIPYLITLFIRARSFTFFSAANPGIEMGGFFGESKIDILKKIPKDYLPLTLFIEKGTEYDPLKEMIAKAGISYPFIAKPNIGERGYMVSKIDREEDLLHYHQQIKADFIIQEYIDFPVELGVLFHRFPDSTEVKITSVVVKEFFTLHGDGKSTVLELFESDVRFRFQLARFREKSPELLHKILAEGEQMMLEPIGNHARGTKFLNGNHLINPQLEEVFAKIALHIEGVNYGRFDLRVKSLEDLYQGKNIRIMEMNGVSSDPGHIYDPSLPFWKAYYDIAYHFYIVYLVGKANHKKGVPYTPLGEFLRNVYQYFYAQPSGEAKKNK